MRIIFRLAAVLLGATCVAGGYYLQSLNMGAPPAPSEGPARRDGWAADIESLRKRTAPSRADERRSLAGKPFEEWFEVRRTVLGVQPEIKTTETEIIMTFNIPGFKAETLRLMFNDTWIRAAYSAKTIEEKRNARVSYRAAVVRQFETIMPAPSNADVRKHRIIPDKKGFVIIFGKREDLSLQF